TIPISYLVARACHGPKHGYGFKARASGYLAVCLHTGTGEEELYISIAISTWISRNSTVIAPWILLSHYFLHVALYALTNSLILNLLTKHLRTTINHHAFLTRHPRCGRSGRFCPILRQQLLHCCWKLQ